MRNTRGRASRRVDAANKVEHLRPCIELKPYKVDDKELCVELKRSDELSVELKASLVDLLETNMRQQYEESLAGWDRSEKEEEMFHPASRHLVLSSGGELVAFSHFRFDLDYGTEVLYCYEIQIHKDWRSKGIGRYMVQILEKLLHRFELTKLVLTVFTSNVAALQFYKTGLGFGVDQTSPDMEHYQILSKVNARLINEYCDT